MSDSMDIFLKDFASGGETDMVMLPLAKALLEMIIVDEPRDRLTVYYEGTSDGMIDITMAFDVGKLNIVRQGIKAVTESEAEAAAQSQPLTGVATKAATELPETPENNPFMRTEEAATQPPGEQPLQGTANSNTNPFAGKPANIPDIMPKVRKGVAVAKKTIQQRRQEFRAELEAKYGRPFGEIKLANIQKNTDRRKYIQFLEESKRIRKADALRPVAESILAKISPGQNRTELETALLAIEEEPTEMELHELEQLIERLRPTTAPEEQTKVAFRPELIRKATRIAEKIEAALKGELATLNPTDRKKLDDNLFLLKTQRNMANDEDEDFDQSDKDRLQRLIAFFEKNYPKILADSEQIASAVTDSESFSQENPLLESKKQQLPSGVSSRIGFGQHMSRQGPGIGLVTQTKKTHQLRIGAPLSSPANPSGIALKPH